MARAKFLCDAERCIECNACVTACKNEHEVPWGINRRRVVTINDGNPGERSISVACMHCSDAPCMAVCPVDCFYQNEEGVVLHSKDLCIGCGAIASMRAPSARRSILRPETSDHAARWTNVPSAPVVPRKRTRPQSSPNTVAIGSPRANCPSAPRCVPPRPCSPVMATWFRPSTANASWRAGLARALGVGARPTTKKTVKTVFMNQTGDPQMWVT